MNVVLLSLVPLRADRVSCYGYHRDTTPTIDELAADGTLFENAYGTSAWTPPSHASTITGRYPWNHGVVGDASLPADVPTMASVLGRHGMRTAGFVNTHHMGAYKGLDAGFASFHQFGTGGWRAKRNVFSREAERRGWRPKNKGTAPTTDAVLRWLDAYATSDRPFFLLVHYHEAHHPYWPPRAHRGRYSGDRRGPSRRSAARRANLDPSAFFTQRVELSDEDIGRLSDLYDEEVAYLDRDHLSRVVGKLKDLGVYDRTVVIVSSPHGESLGEHGLLSHVGGLYEPLVHVPLVVRCPTQARDVRDPTLAQVTDVLPTVLRLLDLPDDGLALDGRCLSPFSPDAPARAYVTAEWSGGGFSRRDLAEAHAFYEDKPHVLARLTRRLEMLRVGSFKYIGSSDGEHELFDLSTDPGELHNLADVERVRVDRFAAKLRELVGDAAPVASGEPRDVPPQIVAGLRAQGYRL